MVQFEEAVAALLKVFLDGYTTIRNIRVARKGNGQGERIKPDEFRLQQLLKQHHSDIHKAYTRDAARVGARFTNGDAKARRSVTAILARLDRAVVKMMRKITKGRASQSDYTALLLTSSISKAETTRTFEQLLSRLSQTSLRRSGRSKHKSDQGLAALAKPEKVVSSSPAHQGGRNSELGKPSPTDNSKSNHATNKPSPDIKIAIPLKLSNVAPAQARVPPMRDATIHLAGHHGRNATFRSSPGTGRDRSQVHITSSVSASSESTRLGEVEQQRRRTRADVSAEDVEHAVFPLTPWSKPEKSRFRLIQFFRRQ